MAVLTSSYWEHRPDAPGRRHQRSGSYRPYLPDPLVDRPLRLGADLAERATQAERAVHALVEHPGAAVLEGAARFLLRSEALASSRIEGLRVSPQQAGLAELALHEGFTGRPVGNAGLVANNVSTLRAAVHGLSSAPTITVPAVSALRDALLPDDPQPGLRTTQNWVGGSDWHPLDAEFVPPPAGEVPRLMHDLAAYASGGLHAPLVQAALVHAQFETIHPFSDGNGRVGRALVHTVLARRGLTRVAVLPVSLVLLTRVDDYVRGLADYRYLGAPDGPAAQRGQGAWLAVFFDAVERAAEQAVRFTAEIDELRSGWSELHRAHRARAGLREAPRAGSAVDRLLRRLPEAPVVTARTVQRLLDVSFNAARDAAEELADAGILQRRQVDRGTTAYLASDVLDLLTLTERRLASTRFDTRAAAPRRAVPATPG